MKVSFFFILALVLSASLFGAQSAFTLNSGAGFLDVRFSDQPVASYVYRDLKIHRPYFTRLHGPGGVQLTRNFPPKEGEDPTDHAFLHPGLWLAFGDLNGEDFWRNRAVVRHARFVQEPEVAAEKVTFTVANEYLAKGRVLANETTRYILQRTSNGFLLVWETEIRPTDQPLRFGDQEEMGLGVRVHTPLTVARGGIIRNQAGQTNEAATRGAITDWVDFSGEVHGVHAGLTLMADAGNFRPSWAHTRDYGLAVLNPFGRKALTGGEESVVQVALGETLRLRFGVLMHAGETPDLVAAYQAF